jgi:hypothetical protein
MRISKLFSAALLLFCFSLLAASQVRADGTTDYVYEAGGNTFTWNVPTNPVSAPNNVFSGEGFIIPDLSFTENGSAMVGTLDFYNTSSGGGFDLWVGNYSFLSNAYGSQLYTGLESAPTLIPGTFSLTDYGNGDCPYGGTLKVIPTPEPSALSMLAIGLAIILGFAFLRKN